MTFGSCCFINVCMYVAWVLSQSFVIIHNSFCRIIHFNLHLCKLSEDSVYQVVYLADYLSKDIPSAVDIYFV